MAAGQGIQARSQRQGTKIQAKHEGHDSNGVGQKSLNKSPKDTDSRGQRMIKGSTIRKGEINKG